MKSVKAQYDGHRVILPADFRAGGVGEVTVTFPDAIIEGADSRPSFWEVLARAEPSGRTIEDVDRQLKELDDGWADPHDELRRTS